MLAITNATSNWRWTNWRWTNPYSWTAVTALQMVKNGSHGPRTPNKDPVGVSLDLQLTPSQALAWEICWECWGAGRHVQINVEQTVCSNQGSDVTGTIHFYMFTDMHSGMKFMHYLYCMPLGCTNVLSPIDICWRGENTHTHWLPHTVETVQDKSANTHNYTTPSEHVHTPHHTQIHPPPIIPKSHTVKTTTKGLPHSVNDSWSPTPRHTHTHADNT